MKVHHYTIPITSEGSEVYCFQLVGPYPEFAKFVADLNFTYPGNWITISQMNRIGSVATAIIGFTDKSNAMRFKLAWCGQDDKVVFD